MSDQKFYLKDKQYGKNSSHNNVIDYIDNDNKEFNLLILV